MSFSGSLRRLHFRDLFTIDFWRQLLRAAWLFFPAVLFLLLTYLAFWNLTQGKDLMMITLEKKDVFGYFIVAIVFWTYITWYSSRLVAKAKDFDEDNENIIWQNFRIHGPRILAFTCFTIVLLAFYQLDGYKINIDKRICLLLLAASFFYYFFIWRSWERFLIRYDKEPDTKLRLKQLSTVRTTTYILLIIASLLLTFFQETQTLMGITLLLLGFQIGLILLLIVRRKILETKGNSASQQSLQERDIRGISTIQKLKKILLDKEDKAYFRVFAVITMVALVFYLTTIFSVQMATWVGTFPFIFLAFGILLLLGNFVALLSVLYRFNFHLLFWVIAFLLGRMKDPHEVQLLTSKGSQAVFDNRQDLKEYFRHWLAQRYPYADSIQQPVPVYFILSDGGASRSGYWAASVMAKLHDETNGAFSRNIFCLSGASGGSVGNATFYNILRRKNILQPDTAATLPLARSYLQSDFLTFTLARMLGPDIFRYVFPSGFIKDRAYALTCALEEACGPKDSLYKTMGTGFTKLVTQKGVPDPMPLICINTTRMQDGRPGVFSTISLRDSFYNNRVDVLNNIKEDADIKLSSAVVLGASFPYVSPAGRINVPYYGYNNKGEKKLKYEPQYYVDGGYFDNSGSGVVNEMLSGLRSYLDTIPGLQAYKNKLSFYIVHITNDPAPGNVEFVLEKVNALSNDLTAPLRTLAGAYGSQTSVNDSRLRNFMRNWYGNNNHYTKINLYKEGMEKDMNFSMNWVISRYLLDSMDARLINPNLEKVRKTVLP